MPKQGQSKAGVPLLFETARSSKVTSTCSSCSPTKSLAEQPLNFPEHGCPSRGGCRSIRRKYSGFDCTSLDVSQPTTCPSTQLSDEATDHMVAEVPKFPRIPLGVITNAETNSDSMVNRTSGSLATQPEERLVKEYAPDVIKRMLKCELEYMPKADYMQEKTEVTSKMRSVLIDWLVDVHKEYGLKNETLFLTVNR